MGVDEAAKRDLWRFLLEIDWTDIVRAEQLPVDESLLLIVDKLNELGLRVYDGLWVRAVDVPAALEASTVADGRATIEITADPQFPENVGTWTVEAGGVVKRSSRRPDVRLDVQGLGSTLLGGFTFSGSPAPAGRRRCPRRACARGRALPGRARSVVPRDLLTRLARVPSRKMIVVTGVSGRVGGLVAAALARRGIRFAR